jgi:GNAT superfamily N-acetyltransferase
MWVTPGARRRGAGKALVEAVSGWARNRGFEKLWLRVYAGNEPARRLYEEVGFRPIQLIMERALEP